MTDKQRIKQIIEVIIEADDKDRFEQLAFLFRLYDECREDEEE